MDDIEDTEESESQLLQVHLSSPFQCNSQKKSLAVI